MSALQHQTPILATFAYFSALGCSRSTPCNDDASPPISSVVESDRSQPTTQDNEQSFVRGSNAFGVETYRKVYKTKNFVMSPIGQSLAFHLLYPFARRATANELRNVAHIDVAPQLAPGLATRFVNRLRAPERSLRLHIGSRTMIDSSVPIGGMPLESIEKTDFTHHKESSIQSLDQWCSDTTDGKINGLIDIQSIEGWTQVVLASAASFDAKWHTPFVDRYTTKEDFYDGNGTARKVETMHGPARSTETQVDGATVRVFEIPYRKDEASLMIILPEASRDLASLEAALTPENLDSWTAAVRDNGTLVGIALPKFTVDSEDAPTLRGALEQLGMTTAFSEAADFSGLAQKLRVRQVAHGALVEVSEGGTATATTSDKLLGPSPRKSERPSWPVNRPFLFAIVDNATGLLLFLGRVLAP